MSNTASLPHLHKSLDMKQATTSRYERVRNKRVNMNVFEHTGYKWLNSLIRVCPAAAKFQMERKIRKK